MITFNFYKIQLLGKQIFANGSDKSHYTNGIIKYLEKTYPRVNFIKFLVGRDELVFLADKDLGEYDKTTILESGPFRRPRAHQIAVHKIKKCYSHEIKNFIDLHPMNCFVDKFNYSTYDFGPNSKIFNKYFAKNILGKFIEYNIV